MSNAVIRAIHQRRSIGNLSLPMPTKAELNEVLQSALAAPDHRHLQPWKFWVLTGGALTRLGEVLLQAEQTDAENKGATLDEMSVKKALHSTQRAPMIIVVATCPKYHEKVPEFEQILSTGAAIENMLLTLESLGYRSIWRTGLFCNSPIVKAHFNLEAQDTICGLVYVGSSAIEMPARPEIDMEHFVEFRE